MTFRPVRACLLPLLTIREEKAILARTLWKEGYNDHLSGHLSVNLHDSTLLCSPWPLLLSEFRPDDVVRIDLDGRLIVGEWEVPPGITLHLALHEARPDIEVAYHNHPLRGTVWSDMREVPPPLDQSSVLGGGELVLVDEFAGTVDQVAAARATIAKIGGADLALLSGHGVLVMGSSIRSVHQRAVALEQRCHRAGCVRAAGSPVKSALPEWFVARGRAMTGEEFRGYWEAMARQELSADPSLLPTASPSVGRP